MRHWNPAWHLKQGLAPLIALACLLPFSQIVPAGEFLGLDVSHKNGCYDVSVDFRVAAPSDQVARILTDYTDIYQLNPAIVESEILSPPGPGIVRVRTVIKGCIGPFCLNVARVEDVRQIGPGILRTEIVPELSDFKSGTTDWQIIPAGDGTRIVHMATTEPDFFVPPFIGSYLLRNAIRKQAIRTFKRLECIALGATAAERPWKSNASPNSATNSSAGCGEIDLAVR